MDAGVLEERTLERDAVTAILTSAGSDPADGAEIIDRLVPLVYEELRAMARRQLGSERDRLTLDTTGLVHEAYLKLVDSAAAPVRSRAYFFGAAARAMRQVLVDAARRRRRLKRGAGKRLVPLEEASVAVDELATGILELDAALGRLAADFQRPAAVVECRYFGGLSEEETAQALDISLRTVRRDWALARAWLLQALGG
jgi:RNA polymerase sigma factor (TIGR02999 family)